jgi:hypothetical protein
MKRFAIVVTSLGLGVLVLVLTLLLAQGGGERGRAPELRASAEPAPAPSALPLTAPAAVPHATEAPAAPAVDAPAAGGAERRPADEVPPVTGIVRLAVPLPADEEVLVTAALRGVALGEVTARMAPDGRFALPVPAQATDVRVGLRARMLRLPALVHVVPGQGGVVLEPEVLAVLIGEVVAPLPEPVRSSDWARIEVRWALAPHVTLEPEALRRAQTLARLALPTWPRDGRFELPRVAPGVELELSVTSAFGPPAALVLAPLAPGERRHVRIELERGIAVSGRVVDEHGAPVARAWVRTDAELLGRPEHTDADGRFHLQSLRARPLRIWVEPYQLLRGADARLDGTRDVSDLVLAVERGGCIAGTVAWPDGAPAQEFHVFARGANERWTFGEAGDFRVCGLAAGRHRIEVEAERDGSSFRAAADDVAHGAELALVLTPAEGAALDGTVVDAAGEPVQTFVVSARCPGCGAARSTSGKAGRFRLTGLEPGRWKVSIQEAGYQLAERELEVGASDETLEVVLLAAGRIRGRVLEPSGAPIAGATLAEAPRALFVIVGEPGRTTDAGGAFDVAASAPRVELTASAGGFAPSAPVAVELAPGETVVDVVLVLREPCRLEGRVLDAQGRPVPFARVLAAEAAFSPPANALGHRDADADGAFVFDALPAGDVHLTATRTAPAQAATATVELVPGEVTRVELRL